MKDKFNVRQINPAWAAEAEEAAIKRRDFHRKRNSRKHWHDPKKGEYTDEIYGNLGQIAVREFFKENYSDLELDFAPLFTTKLKDLPDYDAKIGKARTEIKTIPPDGDFARKRLLVKQSEFKELDYYIAVKFWNKAEYSFCGYVTGKEVAAAPLKNFGYAPAYWFFLDELPHQFKLCPDG